jgi:hypothetical protein
MIRKNCLYLLTATVLASASPAVAESGLLAACGADCQDSALSSLLLAAGMYGGLDGASGQGVDFSMNRSQNKFAGTWFGERQTDAQDITLSYSGSSGRLGFSAGYLYTEGEKNRGRGTVLFGREFFNQDYLGNTEKPWYLTFNIGHSFQVGEDIAFGVGSRTMLLSPPLEDKNAEDRAVCMSLNLPVSYKGFLTVTPEVQWSRPLVGEAGGNADAALADNAFYGGMSVSLSY